MASPDYKSTEKLPAQPNVWSALPNQTAASMEYINSHATQKNGENIPLQPLLPQTMTALRHAFQFKHDLLIDIRRIEMTPVKGVAVSTEDEATPSLAEYEYRLTSVRTYVGEPDADTGWFRLTQPTDGASRQQLRLRFDLFSCYMTEASGSGLASSDDSEYFREVENPLLDPVWALIMPGLIAHDPYTGYAEDKAQNHGPIYQALSLSSPGLTKASRLSCKGFAFNPKAHERQTSIQELIQLGKEMIRLYKLADTPEFTKASNRKLINVVARLISALFAISRLDPMMRFPNTTKK